MKHVEYTYTRGMDDSAVKDTLRESQAGVLALSSDGDSYAIPLAHYYDGGDSLYFRLGVTEQSTKRAFIDSTETASYVLYGAAPTDEPHELDAWSVLITGRLERLSEAESREFDTAEINRQFPPIWVFDSDIDDINIVIVRLDIETMTGRTTLE